MPVVMVSDEEPVHIEFDQLDPNLIKPTSTCAKLWDATTSQIGIIGLHMAPLPSGWGYEAYYEIFVGFPDVSTDWTIRRTYQEFVDLHRVLLTSFHKKMLQRHIQLPKPSRFEIGLSMESRYTQSAKRLQEKLNLYLHRLLEIQDVTACQSFRQFFELKEQDKQLQEKYPNKNYGDQKTYEESPSSNDSSCSTATTTPDTTISDQSSVASETSAKFARRGSNWQLENSLKLNDNISSANHTTNDVVTLQTMHQSRKPAHVLPPESVVVKVTSNCSSMVKYGSTLSLRLCGGLRLGLTKRSAWSGSQKMAAVAAGGAGMVLLSGPVGLTIAAIGSATKHHFSKTYSLYVSPKDKVKHDQFLIESASAFSGAERPVHYGETFRLLNVSRHTYLKVAMPVDSKRGYVSVTSSAQYASLFRWVSPLGYVGPIVCGSPACLQVVDPKTAWADDLLSVHKDYITTDGSPAVFKLILHNHPCLANEDMSQTVKRPLPKPVAVRIMVYNVWFLPPVASSLLNLSPFKSQRAFAIPSVLPSNLDLVVFCEAFDAGAKIVLTTEMKRMGFLYETRNAGSKSSMKAFNSGVFIMSKYPLEHVDELLFGSEAVGDDKIADKGAIYVQMKKGGEVIHVIGTHMQAWENEAAVSCRAKQLEMLSNWVAEKRIPKRDALILAGDFNIDKCASPSKEYDWMLSSLKATNPPTVPGTSEYSFDPFTNVLASKGKSSGGKLERLDYVMFGNENRHPSSSTTQVMPLKVENGWEDKALYDQKVFDLSDHYPVMSEFYFS